MTTTVVKTIGTASRDYSTLQAWEDAAPANLVTADQVWKGECYNDSTFTAGLTISGITTDTTRYVWLTAAAGQSFADNPANALNYNTANGVSVQTGSGYVLATSAANVKIDRLQISGVLGIEDSSGSSATYIDNCIVKTSHYTTGGGCIRTSGNVSNCVLVNTGGGAAAIGFGSAKFFNVTTIQTGAASAYGFRGDYSTPKYTNCAAFGFGTNFRSGYDSASDYNASSQASPPGAHSLGSLTFSDHFVSTSDYKLKATSTLIDAGTATGAPSTDIFGAARPSGSGYDIGASEYVAAGGAATATPAGVSATGSVGAVAATAGATRTLAGVSATGSIGAVTATGGATVSPSGVSASWSVSSPVAVAGGAAIAFPSGVYAISEVGTPAITAGATVSPNGVQASGSVGTPVATGACIAYPLGLAGYWSVGNTIATDGSITPFAPSIYAAASPAINYTAISPAINYTATARQ